MALIGMCVYDPPNECRGDLLFPCLQSLAKTVDLRKHRLILVNNGVCPKCLSELRLIVSGFAVQNAKIIGDGVNIGTARAINKAWKERQPGEHGVKVDSDVILHNTGWLDAMEECVARDPKIGQIGLKRPDLEENPWAPEGDWSHSKIRMLPHQPGQTWLVIEEVRHVMGTCVLHSSALLDKVGFLYQLGGLYGFDDSNMSVRSELAGFINCFLVNHPISHPDPGTTMYQKWKVNYSGRKMQSYIQCREGYKDGMIPLYHGPEDA